jgi:hypothetical protein
MHQVQGGCIHATDPMKGCSMRGRMNQRQCSWCAQKRAVLRLALLAVAPIFAAPMTPGSADAESPGTTARLLLPPLPLPGNASSSLQETKINPFCQPVPADEAFLNDQDRSVAKPSLGSPRPVLSAVYSMPTIQLASGKSFESGNVPMLDGAATTFRLIPPNVPPPAEPNPGFVVGAVRHNPVVDTEQILQDVTERHMPVGDIAKKIDAPISKTTVSVANAVDNTLQNQTLQKQNVLQVNGNQAVGPAITKPNVHEGPVSFSLNDDRLVDTSDRLAKTKPEPQPKSKSLASLLRDEDEAKVPERSSTASPSRSLPRSVTITEPVAEDNSASITRGSAAGRMLLVPLPPANDSMPMAASQSLDARSQSLDARIVKGSRPRVDVGVPPVAIARSANNSAISFAPVAKISPDVPVAGEIALANSKEADLRKANAVSFESTSVVVLDLKPTEVRSLVSKGEIRKVQIGDGTICSAVAAGPMQLQLIATRNGVTRMAVWSAASADEEEKTVYEIRVGTPVQSDANDPVIIASTLTRSAKAAFPNSNLQVRFEKGQMIVEGDCESNESAKSVLRMIRSACLLPVVDKVKVR